MWLNKLHERWMGRPTTGRGSRHMPVQLPHRVRPMLEQLEDRTLLSNYTAATVSQLIADINAANQQGGSNTITLAAPTTSPYSLTGVSNSTDGATGLPVIAAKDNLTIAGNGDTIARSTAAGTPAFRLFDVAAGAALTLQHLTVQGGLAFGAGVSAEGGAIYSQGTLVLGGVAVQNNTAQGSNGGIGQAGWSAAGGGIYSGGALTLEGGAVIEHNQALGGEGGHGRPSGTVGNGRPAGRGGNGLGGGLYVAGGTLSVTDATLSADTAQGGQGGPAYVRVPAGYGGYGEGGGLFVAGGTATLSSALLSADSAQGGPGGLGGGFGGGICIQAGTLTLRNDRVTGNSAQGGGPGVTPVAKPGLGEGGGLAIDPAAVVCLDHFTHGHVANNTASSSDPNIDGQWKRC